MNDATRDFLDTAVRRLDEGLNRRGFRTQHSGDLPTEWEWTGRLGPRRELVRVTLQPSYPFSPPNVSLPDRATDLGWHSGPEGILCLWTEEGQAGIPWLDPTILIERIESWIANDAAGWIKDSPQLDLEAYHQPRFLRVNGSTVHPSLLIDRWDGLSPGWFISSLPDAHGVMRVKRAKTPPPPAATPGQQGARRKNRKPDRFLNGVAIDLGELAKPVISPSDLVAACGSDGPAIGKFLETGRPLLVAMRYRRGAGDGYIGFWLEDKAPLTYISVAERAQAQRRRAGWHAPALRKKSVSVIGAGSIGSYVAEVLDRSGVGDLRVHDFDKLLPGNLVRHAASPAFVGQTKTTAVCASALLRDPGSSMTGAGPVKTFADAVSLMDSRDLVIDCTGSRLVWHMLQHAARLSGARFLHVAIVGQGQFGRADICPPLNAAEPLSMDPLEGAIEGEYETGCGDPISPTPPAAVIETAGMGARLAIRLLCGEEVPPAGESRALFELPT